MRDGVNLSRLQVTRPLVMHTEVTNLPNLTGFLRFGRNLPVVRFEDRYNDLPVRSAPFVEKFDPPFRHTMADELVRIARAESKLRDRLEKEQVPEAPMSVPPPETKAPARPSRRRQSKQSEAQAELFSAADPKTEDAQTEAILDAAESDAPIDTKTAWEHLAARQNRIRSSLVQHGRADGSREAAKPA